MFFSSKSMNQKILNRREDGVVSGFSKILNSGEMWMYYLPTVLYSDDLLIPVACFNYRRFKPAWIETHKALPVTPSSFPFANPTFSNERKQLQHFPLWKLEETQIPNSLLSRAPASVYVHARARALSVCTHTTANSLDLTPGLFLFHSRLAKRMRSTLPPKTPHRRESLKLRLK